MSNMRVKKRYPCRKRKFNLQSVVTWKLCKIECMYDGRAVSVIAQLLVRCGMQVFNFTIL